MLDVLVVGAGPTGLVHALWLHAQGVNVRIIDKTEGPGTTSRAMAVQSRTLELYRQLGLTDEVVSAGFRTPAMNMWARGKHRLRVPLQEIGTGISPHPYILVYPQDFHEKTLVAKLQSFGIEVERNTELLSLEDKGEHVEARLRHADGTEEITSARYLAACDGASSTVRKQLGIGFEGGTYQHVFYVADVDLSGLDNTGEAHVALNGEDFVVVLFYDSSGKARLIGTVRDERADHPEKLTFDDVGHEAMASVGIHVDKVNWFSHYRVHHRVADHFRQGRVFLMGDAAHVHSPVGGQGMNTGILDAINLAWKLEAVIHGQAPDALLDTYATERQAFAHELVKTTDRVFSLITADGEFANLMRSYGVPLIAGAAFKIGSTREMLFKMVSQTGLAYKDSALSEGRAGEVQGGERLPWVNVNGQDNFEPLPVIGWQVHVYGTATAEVRAWCVQNGVTLRQFAWAEDHGEAGLKQDAVYLLRPDTWVALADPEGSADTLDAYFTSRSYQIGKEQGGVRD
ncbi:FAD-dependent monooxygenase [Luteibacter sp. RCC_6_2]|uniref:FAD-dependent monooxygenase n=1 Tax=Luteibacter sp. RCC_6_2 TaxID=3239223 RepID=UPI00352674DB